MIALLNFCSFPWWLAWLLPALLGLLAGWAIWSGWKKKYEALVSGGNSKKVESGDVSLKSDLDACLKSRKDLESQLAKAKKEIKNLQNKKSNSGNVTAAATGAVAGLAASKLTSEEPTSWNVASTRVDDKEQIKTLKKSLDSLREKNNELSQKFDDLRKEKDDLQFKYDDLAKELDTQEDVDTPAPVNTEELENKLKAAEDKFAKCQEDVVNLKTRYSSVDKQISKAEREATEWKIKYNALKNNMTGTAAVVGSSALVAKADESYKAEVVEPTKVEAEAPKVVKPAIKKSAYSAIQSDNLQIIEGIGPKMEEVLKDNDVNDFTALAGHSQEDLRGILGKYGDKYKIIDPTTWAQQAALARDEKWEELIQLQKDLDGGKETASGQTDSKLEKILIKMGALKKWKQDDLKAIEGIGPKLEEVFHNAGIKTWKALSETSVEKIKELLAAAGGRFALAVPDTWPKQAKMADEGDFQALQEYQDYLDGGKEPS